MGIDCRLYAVDSPDAARITASSFSRGPRLARPEAARCCDLHKAWHAIHFVLTGEVEGGPEPNCYLLEGGTPLGRPADDARPRYLSPEQVRAFDGVLQPINRLSTLRERFDHAAMVVAGVYSINEGEAEAAEDLEFTAHYFRLLRMFIRAAAEARQGVVITLG